MSDVGLLAAKILLLVSSYLWAYWQLFKGAGRWVGMLIGLAYLAMGLLLPGLWPLLVVIFILIGVFAFARSRIQEGNYEAPKMVFEGGGIHRGLSPIEVGHYWGVPRLELLGLSILELLNKGLLRIDGAGVLVAEILLEAETILNPTERRKARKAQARRIGKELTDLEDILLEILIQYQDGGLSLAAFQVWEDQLAVQAHYRVGGFDVARTLEYYREYLAHRVSGVAAGHFPAGSFLPWIRLAYLNDIPLATNQTAHQVLAETKPSWLPEGLVLNQWLDTYLATLPD